jgi:hypothetical protein
VLALRIPALLTLVALATPALAGAMVPVATIAPIPASECMAGGAWAMLDGSRSYDPDGEPIALHWSAPGIAFDNPRSSMPTARFPLGITMVTLTATDDAGNAGTAMAEVRIVDTTLPMTSIALAGDMGMGGWYTSAVSASLEGSDACALDQVLAAKDGSAFAPATMVAFDGDGNHLLEAYSTDVAGNAERVQHRTLRIDATPPSVRLLDPVKDQVYVGAAMLRLRAEGTPVGLPAPIVAGPLEVRADAADATSGVAMVEFLVDGQVRASLAAPPWAWTWDSAAEAPGSHVVAAKAMDKAGNAAMASQTVFVVPGPAA